MPRVVFTFDEKSLADLKKLQEEGDFPSMGGAVRDSITVNELLRDQASKGFSEVILRNPETSEERVVLIPSLRRAAAHRSK